MSVKDYPAQDGRHGYVVVNASLGERLSDPIALRHDEYLIVRDCPICDMEARTIVPAQGLWDWEHGKFAQAAFPDLTPDQREQVMTGTHPDCWDAAFGDDE